MPTWNPDQYLTFTDHRLRPALDLIGRMPRIDAATIWDLGCGAGNVTRYLANRWPGARIIGMDSSEEMLERARSIQGIEWVRGEIESWDPGGRADIVFANAALHWVGGHDELFPRILSMIDPGGVLAVQMPRNFGEPSHSLLQELASSDEFSEDLGHLVSQPPVGEPSWYHELIDPLASDIDMWETIYQQVLDGPDPVANWTKGTAARPYLDALSPERAGTFFTEYAAALAVAYPSGPSGTTLFPFRRMFMVATV